MKILVHLSDREHIQNILTGWINALTDSGYEVRAFKGQESPVFRELELFKPDLFILEPLSVTKAVKKAVQQFGTKTVILTDKKLMNHQQITDATVVSYKEVENYLVVSLGIDYPQYKNPAKDEFYACDSALITSKKLDFSFDKADRIYSNIPQKSVAYSGSVKNKKKVYSSTGGIYLNKNEEYTDVDNMYFCGANVWDMDDVCAGNCDCADQQLPPKYRQSYHHRLKELFGTLGFDTANLDKRIEEISNEEDWLSYR